MESKKILVVYAHPESKSMCGSLKNKCVETFTKQGCSVTVRDLYDMKFDAVGGPNDFTQPKYSDSSKFRYAEEQKHAVVNGTVKSELAVEHNYLTEADVIVLVFPMWWGSVPAIMKGWIDRTLFHGVAWDVEGFQMFNNGLLKGKKAFCVVTTGSPKEVFTETGDQKMTVEERLEHITFATLAFTGLSVYPTFIANGVSPMTEKKAIESKLEDFEKYLQSYETLTPIY